jgi:hypothetical protein
MGWICPQLLDSSIEAIPPGLARKKSRRDRSAAQTNLLPHPSLVAGYIGIVDRENLSSPAPDYELEVFTRELWGLS